MIDEIDKNIVLDAHDDYELVAHTVLEIARLEGVSHRDAWNNFLVRFKRLSSLVPICLYKANSLDGNMKEASLEQLKIGDVLDSDGNVSGPPFILFYRSKVACEEEFDAFFKMYGLPTWLQK